MISVLLWRLSYIVLYYMTGLYIFLETRIAELSHRSMLVLGLDTIVLFESFVMRDKFKKSVEWCESVVNLLQEIEVLDFSSFRLRPE